jgi:hypothetical protein
VKPRIARAPVLPVQHMRCPCCAGNRAFKIMYTHSIALGVRLVDVRQFCDCQIEDETLRRLCIRAAEEHHEGQLI